ncbi:MAG: hypothetical protein WA081_11840 [Desulfosalsimonadaceae bacterium]
MKPSKPFLKTGVIGLLVVVMSIGLLAVFPSTAPNMLEGFFTPIIAFEFIQTRAEVFGMFIQADGAESVNEAMLAAFDLGNRLDYIYMGLYSVFLALFSLTCVKISGKKYFYTGAVLSLVVLAGDAFENIQLMGITSYLKHGMTSGDMETLLNGLNRFTWMKWGGLAAIFLVLAPWFLRGGRFSKAVGLSGIACAGLGLAAFFHRSVITEIFSLSVGLMFLLMIIYCFRRDGSAPYFNPHTSR